MYVAASHAPARPLLTKRLDDPTGASQPGGPGRWALPEDGRGFDGLGDMMSLVHDMNSDYVGAAGAEGAG